MEFLINRWCSIPYCCRNSSSFIMALWFLEGLATSMSRWQNGRESRVGHRHFLEAWPGKGILYIHSCSIGENSYTWSCLITRATTKSSCVPGKKRKTEHWMLLKWANCITGGPFITKSVGLSFLCKTHSHPLASIKFSWGVSGFAYLWTKRQTIHSRHTCLQDTMGELRQGNKKNPRPFGHR